MSNSEKQFLFGFLNAAVTLEFDNVKFKPLPDHQARLEQLQEQINPDGFVYPPYEVRVIDPLTEEPPRVVPGSERPALLHRLPASHLLQVRARGEVQKVRRIQGMFLIHALAFVYGRRFQFGSSTGVFRLILSTTMS